IYGGLAALMVVGVIATLIAEEPAAPADVPRRPDEALWRPFVELFTKLGPASLVLVLLLAALYRFGDSFAQALLIPFLKKGVGFSSTDIGLVNKALGFLGMMVGGIAAGSLVARHGARRLLVPFAILAAIT